MPAQLLVVGLDPSPKRLGYAVARVSERGFRPLKCGTMHMEPGPHAVVGAMKSVRRRIDALGGVVTLIGIEKGFVGVNQAVAGQIMETMGGVAALCAVAWPHPEIKRVTPSGWRKLSGLSGRASKAEVFERALQLGWEIRDGDQDAADAALIAWAARPA